MRRLQVYSFAEKQPRLGQPVFRVFGEKGVITLKPDMLREENPEKRLPGEPAEGPMIAWFSGGRKPRPTDLWVPSLKWLVGHDVGCHPHPREAAAPHP